MNKNWFYKVLALALVALMVLPVFALAEEVAAPAVDEADLAETTEGAVSDEAVAKAPIWMMELPDDIIPPEDFVGVVELTLGYTGGYLGEFYMEPPTEELLEELEAEDITCYNGFSIYVSNADYMKSLSFKSSNKKVATVDTEGNVYFVNPGRATITVRGYAVDYNGKTSKSKKTAKITFDVKDPFAVDDLIVGWAYSLESDVVPESDWDPILDFDKNLEDGDTLDVLPGQAWIEATGLNPGMVADVGTSDMIDVLDWGYSILAPIPLNSDGLSLSGAYFRGYNWKWSNTKVAFWDPRASFDAEDRIVKKKAVSSGRIPANKWLMMACQSTIEEYGEQLVPVFYQSGKSKLSFKVQPVGGNKTKKTTVTINVKENKREFAYGTDAAMLNMAKDNDCIIYALGKVEVKNVDKVEITLKIYNGTGWTCDNKFLKKGVVFSMDTNQGHYIDDAEIPFVRYGYARNGKSKILRNNDVKGKIKAYSTNTITITCTNKRNNDFLVTTDANTAAEIAAPYQWLNSPYFAAENIWFGFSEPVSVAIVGYSMPSIWM